MTTPHLPPLNALTVVDLAGTDRLRTDKALSELGDLQSSLNAPYELGALARTAWVPPPSPTPTATPYRAYAPEVTYESGTPAEGLPKQPSALQQRLGEMVSLPKAEPEGILGRATPFVRAIGQFGILPNAPRVIRGGRAAIPEGVGGPSVVMKGTGELGETGESIASKLGVKFDGVQEGIGKQFTDPITGSTTYAESADELSTKLSKMRAAFAEGAELSPTEKATMSRMEAGNLFKEIQSNPEERVRADLLAPIVHEQSDLLPIILTRADNPKLLESAVVRADDGSVIVRPPPTAFNVLGLTDIPVTLSRSAQMRNIARNIFEPVVKGMGGKLTPEIAEAESAKIMGARWRGAVESMAHEAGQRFGAKLAGVFKFDATGRLPELAGVDPILGVPGLADVADRLPTYMDALTPAQRGVMLELRDLIAPIDNVYAQMGGERGTRPNIMEGGFYIPRGRTDLTGVEVPQVAKGIGRGGKPGALRRAAFGSQAEATGHAYNPTRAIQEYVGSMGNKIVDMHLANFYNSFAVEAGRGTGIMKFAGTEGKMFPAALANSADAMARSTGIIKVPIVEAAEAMLKNVRANYDISPGLIQGLMTLYRDPVTWGKGMGVILRSWADEHVLGSQMDDFTIAWKRAGRLTPAEIALEGLVIGGGQATELTSRGGVLPLIKQSNRAFDNFITSVGLMRADKQIQYALGRGRTIADMRQSGELRRLMEAVNRSVGRGEGTAGWSLGRFFGFAPRWLQSQIETVYRAGKGLTPYGGMDDRMATRDIMQMVAEGVGMTYLLNEVRGKETDWRPIVNGHTNPNFVVLRDVAGHDISIFGPLASLVSLVTTVGTGDPARAARSRAGVLPGAIWSLASGRDYRGHTTRSSPEDVARWIFDSFAPLSATSLAQTLPETESNVGKGLIAAGTVTGLRESPLTPFEQFAKYAEAKAGVPYADMTPLQQKQFKTSDREGARLYDAAQTAAHLSGRVSPFLAEVDRLGTDRTTSLVDYADKTRAGEHTTVELHKAIGVANTKYGNQLAGMQGNPMYKKAIDELQNAQVSTRPAQEAWRRYNIIIHDPALDHGLEGFDFAERDKRLAQFRLDIGADAWAQIQATVQVQRAKEDPLVQAHYVDMEKLRPYWEVPASLVPKLAPAQRPILQRWIDTSDNVGRADLVRNSPTLKEVMKHVAAERATMRRENPEIDAALQKWYGYLPREVKPIKVQERR